MISRLALRLRRRPILVGIVVLLLVVVLVFGGRAAWRLGVRLLGPPPPPRQTDLSLIADWMSIPYIRRAYRVPESELFGALGLTPLGRRTQSLRELAEETGRSSDEAVEIVREAVRAWQETHSRPPGAPAGPSPPPLPKPKPGEPTPTGLRVPSDGSGSEGGGAGPVVSLT